MTSMMSDPEVTEPQRDAPDVVGWKEPARALISQGYGYTTILHAGSFRLASQSTSLPEGGFTGEASPSPTALSPLRGALPEGEPFYRKSPYFPQKTPHG